MNRQALSVYLQTLEQAGWHRTSQGGTEKGSTEVYFHIKGNALLTVVFTADEKNPVSLRYREGAADEPRNGAIRKAQAIPLIQKSLERAGTITALAELEIPGTFEKAGMQIFEAYADGDCAGCFLFCGTSVLPLGMWQGAQEFCVADIDADGEYELIQSAIIGSGLVMQRIAAYKYGSPPDTKSAGKQLYEAYGSAWALGNEYAELLPLAVGETQVRLYCLLRDARGKPLSAGEFGVLRLQDRGLEPEALRDSPFYVDLW